MFGAITFYCDNKLLLKVIPIIVSIEFSPVVEIGVSNVTTPNVYYRKTKISTTNTNLIIVPINPTKSHVYTPDQLHETINKL